MAQEMTINTSSGGKFYKLSQTSGIWYCYRYAGGLFSNNWDQIGKARSMEDAITICRSHATRYGRVYGVDFT